MSESGLGRVWPNRPGSAEFGPTARPTSDPTDRPTLRLAVRPSDRPSERHPTDGPSDRPSVRPPGRHAWRQSVRHCGRRAARPSGRPSISLRPPDRLTERPADALRLCAFPPQFGRLCASLPSRRIGCCAARGRLRARRIFRAIRKASVASLPLYLPREIVSLLRTYARWPAMGGSRGGARAMRRERFDAWVDL